MAKGFLLTGNSTNSSDIHPDNSSKSVSFFQIFNFNDAENTFWTVIIIFLILFAIFVICLFISKNQRTRQERRTNKKRLLGRNRNRKQKKKKIYMFADPNDPNKVIYAKFNKKKGKYIPIKCDTLVQDYNGLEINCIDNQFFINNLNPNSRPMDSNPKRKNKMKKLYVFHDSTDPNRLIYAKYNKKTRAYIPVKYETICQNYNQIDMTYVDNITFQQQAGKVDPGLAYAPPSETNQFY